MHQPEVHDSNNVSLSESQIYDDLSQIIKFFKSILTSMENICATLYRYESINSLMQQLRETMKVLYGYVKLYSTPVDNHSQHRKQQITFHRFICRLIESISAYKVKYQNLPYFSFLSSDINIIQQGVISYQQQRNIGSVIKKLQSAINRFCNKMIKKYQSYMKTDDDENDDVLVSHDKGSSEFPAISGECHHQVLQKQHVKGMELLAVSMEVKTTTTKKALQSKSQSSLNRVMNLLTRRFKTISCLDIEYNEFKQFFFRSRDSKQQLFDDCLQRNSLIYKQMLRYGRQFTEYMQRKELKLFRKNKFVDSLIMGGASNRVRRGNNNNSSNEQEVGYNFTKKRVNNYSHYIQQGSNNQHMRKVMYRNQVHTENSSQQYHQGNVTNSMMEKGEFVDGRESHLRSIEQDESYGSLISQLIASPQLSDKAKYTYHSRDKDNEEKFQDMTTETLLELTKRKKNLQLKKIDISLSTFSVGGEVQSAKGKMKLLNAQVFKKTPIQSIKHFEQKITTSIRKNYLHKKYEQAMKRNLNDTLVDEPDMQKIQQPSPTQYSSSVKCIDPEGEEESPGQMGKQRKYLFKTSNKRNSNGGAQFKSLNHQQQQQQQRKQFSTNKNFRKLKMEQGDKIERLERMKEMALNHIQLRSGGRAIRPAFMYRQRESTQHPYIQITQQDFSDANLGPYRQVQQQ